MRRRPFSLQQIKRQLTSQLAISPCITASWATNAQGDCDQRRCPHPRKMSMVTFFLAHPNSRWATFPFDRGLAQVLQQKPTAPNRCRDF